MLIIVRVNQANEILFMCQTSISFLVGRKQPRLPGPGIKPPGAGGALYGGGGAVDASAASSSMMSSELESSVFDSEDVQSMASSRFTTSTDHTSVSQQVTAHFKLC